MIVWSRFAFGGLDEPATPEEALRPYLLEPAPAIRSAARLFELETFRGRRMVGLHIRRTDHQAARQLSPDEEFIREARAAQDAGAAIFLATDNAATEAIIRRELAGPVVTYPKRAELAERWPRRKYSARDSADDFVDLLLLAVCDYVIGSAGSSFSRQAIIRNGSDRCKVIGVVPPGGMGAGGEV
jgi:hypothetical protein